MTAAEGGDRCIVQFLSHAATPTLGAGRPSNLRSLVGANNAGGGCGGSLLRPDLGRVARLLVDIWSMKLFVWMLGRNGELLDSHLFFFDRYTDLADYHRLRGRTAKADRLAAIAERTAVLPIAEGR